jgi:DNA-binding LytR/AlgR family response regulator
MINCIAIDDEPLALEIIASFSSRIPTLKLHKTFTDTSEAAKYLRKFPVDLIFLDINMPDQNGLNFYKEHGQNRMVIFSTAYSEFAVEGFNVNAIDYLLKPYDFERFEKAVNKAVEYFNFLNASSTEERRFLFVRSEYSLVRIPFSEISHIETLDDYIKIFIAGKKPVLTKMNLKNVMDKLDQNEFIRVHRSFIINRNKITSVRGKTILLQDLTEIPIGIKFESQFFSNYTRG